MKIKLLVAFSLVTFFVSVTAILAAGLVIYELKRPQNGLLSRLINPNASPNNNGLSDELQQAGVMIPQAVVPTLTNEEIAKHHVQEDCWLTIQGNVYDVSGYIFQHPGGAGEIIPFCGSDATNAFATKGKNPSTPHSQIAVNLLAGYYIGTLGQPIEQSGFIANIPVPSPAVSKSVSVRTGISRPASPLPVVPAVVAPITNNPTPQVSLTLAEVSTHNTLQNCWIVVSGSVYDVTRYIVSHPGGVSTITNTCGTDATTAFQTRGGKGSNHSQGAYGLLSQYAIGTLGSSVSVNPPENQTSGGISGGVATPAPGPNQNPQPPNSNNGSQPDTVQSKYPGATIKDQNIEDDGRSEIKLEYQGQCRQIKTSSNGTIIKDESC